MLDKKWDKKLLIACATWQFIDGLITIILGFLNMTKMSDVSKTVPISSFNGLVGTMFILAGLINLLIAYYFLSQKEINKWIMPILVMEVIISYFCMDIIAVGTLVPAVIIISLKKKRQKLVNSQ